MKVKQKPLSFSLHPDNHTYIEGVVAKEKLKNHRYNRSMYMDDLITHLRTKAEAKVNLPAVEVKKPKAPSKRFVPPTVEEVREYCDSRCNNVDANKFVAHFETAGWKRGNTSIKNWKACVHTWEGKDKSAVKSDESLQGNW